MTSIKVWPTKKTAVGLKHPHAHPLSKDGTLWPLDSFTGRRLTDGSVTKVEADAYVEPAAEPVDSAPAETSPAPAAPAAEAPRPS